MLHVTIKRGQSAQPFFRVVIFIIVYTLQANNFTLSPTHRGNRHRHILIHTPLRVSQFTCGADTWSL